jgi:predicted nucleotidyltransferase
MSPSRDGRIAANGHPIADNFKAWMGNSRVRGVMYHATNNVFDSFEVDRSDLGAHFGNLEQMTHLESRLGHRSWSDTADGMLVMPVWLRVENPLRLKDVGTFHADGIAEQLEKKGILAKGEGKRIAKECDADSRQRKVHDPVLRQKIIDAGFDGVVYKNEHEGAGESFIAFDPRQIKSAIGNSGLFLKDSASLTDTQEALQLNLAHKARAALPKALKEKPARLRVFGSRADGSNRQDSDIDVLLEGSELDKTRIKAALLDFSIEMGGPLDLFVLGSVDNEIDLVAAYAPKNDTRIVSVGDADDLDEVLSDARDLTLEDLVRECKAVDGLWNESTSHDRLSNKKRARMGISA